MWGNNLWGSSEYGSETRTGNIFSIVLSETLHFTATVFKRITRKLSETLNFTDIISIKRKYLRILTENVHFYDSIKKNISKVLNETLKFIDYIQFFLNGLRTGLWDKTEKINDEDEWKKNSKQF